MTKMNLVLGAVAALFTSVSLNANANPYAPILECDLSVSTAKVAAYRPQTVLVSTQHATGEDFGIYNSDMRQVGQLELIVDGHAGGEPTAWAPTGVISAYPQFSDKFGVPLSFIKTKPNEWVANYSDIKRSDNVVYQNPIGVSGSVKCQAVSNEFAVVDLQPFERPEVLNIHGENLTKGSLDNILNDKKYCIVGDSQALYSALQSSDKFTRQSSLRVLNDGEIAYKLDLFVCDQGHTDVEGLPVCDTGHTVKDGTSVSLSQCKSRYN